MMPEELGVRAFLAGEIRALPNRTSSTASYRLIDFAGHLGRQFTPSGEPIQIILETSYHLPEPLKDQQSDPLILHSLFYQ